jgi:hypothetical protein
LDDLGAIASELSTTRGRKEAQRILTDRLEAITSSRLAGLAVSVERSYCVTARVETASKGRQTRWSVLPEQVAQPLAGMGQPAITSDPTTSCSAR